MKIPPSIMILTISMGTISNSWFLLWLMMEINSPMFAMTMISLKENPSNPLNYFMFQSLSSMLLLLILINIFMQNSPPTKTPLFNQFITLVSFMKMGMIPLHNWMFNIMKTLKKNSLWMILTLQKILPLKIMSLSFMSNMTMIISMSNLLLSNFLIMKTPKFNLIMMASSMFNMSWISINLNLSNKLSSIFFIIYSMITTLLIMEAKKMNLKTLNFKTPKLNINFLLLTLSISGIPPLWGFISKLILINLMLSNNMPKPTIIILMTSSILMLNGYLKLTFNMTMKNLKNKPKIKNKTTWITLLNLVTPTLIPLM